MRLGEPVVGLDKNVHDVGIRQLVDVGCVQKGLIEFHTHSANYLGAVRLTVKISFLNWLILMAAGMLYSARLES
jgi:hypothetical protein